MAVGAEMTVVACSIYLVTNTLNGKQYVGMTRRLPEERWREHKMLAASGNAALLHEAIRQDGVDAFTFQILEEGIDVSEVGIAEGQWIVRHGTMAPAGYNKALCKQLAPSRKQSGYRFNDSVSEALRLAAFQQRRTIQDIIDEAVLLWLAGRK